MSDLFRETAGVVTRDDIFAMVALGTLDVDLSAAPLTEPDKVHVRLIDQSAVPMEIGLHADAPAAEGLLPQMGPTQMAEANRRLKLIRAYQAGEPLEENVPARTIRHWLHQYRQAEALQG